MVDIETTIRTGVSGSTTRTYIEDTESFYVRVDGVVVLVVHGDGSVTHVGT